MLPKFMDIFISINRLHRSLGQVFAFRKSLDDVVPLNVDRRNVKQRDDALRLSVRSLLYDGPTCNGGS